LCGDAHNLMAEIEAWGPYDLAFVDADKSGYPDYLSWCEKNVRRGGLIVGDNTFLWGALGISRSTTSMRSKSRP